VAEISREFANYTLAGGNTSVLKLANTAVDSLKYTIFSTPDPLNKYLQRRLEGT
jgi:hypothetical protein